MSCLWNGVPMRTQADNAGARIGAIIEGGLRRLGLDRQSAILAMPRAAEARRRWAGVPGVSYPVARSEAALAVAEAQAKRRKREREECAALRVAVLAAWERLPTEARSFARVAAAVGASRRRVAGFLAQAGVLSVLGARKSPLSLRQRAMARRQELLRMRRERSERIVATFGAMPEHRRSAMQVAAELGLDDALVRVTLQAAGHVLPRGRRKKAA